MDHVALSMTDAVKACAGRLPRAARNPSGLHPEASLSRSVKKWRATSATLRPRGRAGKASLFTSTSVWLPRFDVWHRIATLPTKSLAKWPSNSCLRNSESRGRPRRDIAGFSVLLDKRVRT